jgi:type 1 fimbria pilin
MKNYRIAAAALVLMLVLSMSAFAADGIMVTGIAAPTPTPTVNGVMVTGATGEISPTNNAASTLEATGIALNLLRTVLMLF